MSIDSPALLYHYYDVILKHLFVTIHKFLWFKLKEKTTTFYVQVGAYQEPSESWNPPEMDSADQRPVYSVDVGSPGTDAAAETSAASIVLKNIG